MSSNSIALASKLGYCRDFIHPLSMRLSEKGASLNRSILLPLIFTPLFALPRIFNEIFRKSFEENVGTEMSLKAKCLKMQAFHAGL